MFLKTVAFALLSFAVADDVDVIANTTGDEEVTNEDDLNDEDFAAEEALLQEFQGDVTQLVTEVDGDKDGKISLQELLAFTAQPTEVEGESTGDAALIEQEGKENAEVTKLFGEADSDKDGHLSPDEIMSGLLLGELDDDGDDDDTDLDADSLDSDDDLDDLDSDDDVEDDDQEEEVLKALAAGTDDDE